MNPGKGLFFNVVFAGPRGGIYSAIQLVLGSDVVVVGNRPAD